MRGWKVTEFEKHICYWLTPKIGNGLSLDCPFQSACLFGIFLSPGMELMHCKWQRVHKSDQLTHFLPFYFFKAQGRFSLCWKYHVYTVGFVLIPQLCPRSEKPVVSKGYCAVPKVQVTLKKKVQQELLDGAAGCH